MSHKVISNNTELAVRADVLLANNYPQYSRAALAKLFDLNLVLQNDNPLKPGDKIKPGNSIKADISPLKKHAKKINLPIIYEDKDVIVIDKPIGVISHARGKYWDEPSVASFIRDRITSQKPHADTVQGDTEHRTEPYKKYSEGEAEVSTQQSTASSDRVVGSASKQADTMWSSGGERAGIVHRLDRATSGVMICVKNSDSLKFLQKQFANRRTKKTYLAVITGTLEPKEAIIDIPLARNPKKPTSFKADANGKNAITKYKILKSNDKYSLVELKPETGRTHQLRVHLKYINHPIVGDELYNGEPADRLYLHAHSLEITTPDKQRRTFTSKLPPNFTGYLK